MVQNLPSILDDCHPTTPWKKKTKEIMWRDNIIAPDLLVRKNSEQGSRVYLLPDGQQFLSVTSWLDSKLDKSALLAWRRRVGEREANRISAQSAEEGSRFHARVEQAFLRGKSDLEMPLLTDNVTSLYAQEMKLYSRKLSLAGTADLVCDWQNKPAILDYKRLSRRTIDNIYPAKIANNFLQLAIYGWMARELTRNIIVENLVVYYIDYKGNQMALIEDWQRTVEALLLPVLKTQEPLTEKNLKALLAGLNPQRVCRS